MVCGQVGHFGHHVARLVDKVQQHVDENVLTHRHKMAGRHAQGTPQRVKTAQNVHVQVSHYKGLSHIATYNNRLRSCQSVNVVVIDE